MTTHSLLAMAASAGLLLLSGCVQADGFPSLAQRPAERDLSVAAPARPALEVPPDAALRERIAGLQRQAEEGERSFVAALAAAEASAAAAGAAESESWVQAQIALSRLEAARTDTASALRELDQLALARADMATNADDHAVLNAALAAAERLTQAQRARWERLRGRLGRP